jgi:fumarate hydratase class I
MGNLVYTAFELIAKTSTDLSDDVEKALGWAYNEENQPSARNIIEKILENVELARVQKSPICQDTGLANFFVKCPASADPEELKNDLTEGVRLATKEGLLRPNAVHPLSGKNSGDNTGICLPYFDFQRNSQDETVIELLLKGGGSENVGAQYRLPDIQLKAGRDIKGVEKCILDAVHKAQGFGCSPGIAGICIGGDRSVSYARAKKQLLRKLDDKNPDDSLRELEDRLFIKLNNLGIGPMGFGGKVTVLGVKITSAHRHPASFFLSMSYCCWADRRRKAIIKNDSYVIE